MGGENKNSGTYLFDVAVVVGVLFPNMYSNQSEWGVKSTMPLEMSTEYHKNRVVIQSVVDKEKLRSYFEDSMLKIYANNSISIDIPSTHYNLFLQMLWRPLYPILQHLPASTIQLMNIRAWQTPLICIIISFIYFRYVIS